MCSSLIVQFANNKTTMNTKALRQKILDLAIHGKLVQQDPNDEPASVLLERIKAEKERLIKEGKIKRPKRSKAACDKPHYEKEAPFGIPDSWRWTTIEDIAESNIGLTYKPSDICDNGIPVYRSNNIQNRRIDITDLVRVDTKILNKQYLAVGDLLICARNGSRRLVGKCAIIRELSEPSSFGAFMAVCRSAYNPWIYLLLNTSYFDRYLDDSNSTAINQVTQSMLLTFRVPFPPKKEQDRIIEEVNKWFKLIEMIEQRRENLQTVISTTKSKILDLAIHGKLVPQDPTDEPASELLKRINPKAEIACDNAHYRNLPKGWAEIKVGNVAEYTNGRAFKPEEWESVGLPIIRIQNLNDADAHYNRSSIIHEHKYLVKDGDLLFAWAASLGTYIWNGGDAWLNQHIFKVEPFSFIDKTYLFYVFQSMISEFYRNSHGSGMVHITKKQFEEITLLLPPLSEQYRIVEFLERTLNVLDSINCNF